MSETSNEARTRVKRRLRRILGVLGALTALSLYDHYGHTARVYDGTTGKPLAGVYVVGKWSSELTLFGTHYACYKLLVTQTDAEGRYRMPHWSWSFRGWMPGITGKVPIYYKPGYYVAQKDLGLELDQALMWPDTRPANERLWAIGWDQDDMQLCARGEMAPTLISVYEAMTSEATAIAVTRSERIYARDIRNRLNAIRYGQEIAERMNREEREREEKTR